MYRLMICCFVKMSTTFILSYLLIAEYPVSCYTCRMATKLLRLVSDKKKTEIDGVTGLLPLYFCTNVYIVR